MVFTSPVWLTRWIKNLVNVKYKQIRKYIYFQPIKRQSCTPNATLYHHPLRLVNHDFGDVYFSAEDGFAESMLVFIDGNDLVPRMRNSRQFTIAETGFGAGLNFLAVLRQWRLLDEGERPWLHYIATEIAPLENSMISAVFEQIPEITDDAEMMARDLPPRWAGQHRRHFCNGQVTLDLLYGDSLAMISQSDFKANAWFLDGFAPSKNPEMWSDELFRTIADHSAPDATLASFTAAGLVRRGLAEVGFEVTRLAGFRKKRHRIVGQLTGKKQAVSISSCADSFDEEVVIIGAGIAGASVAAGLIRGGTVPLVLGRRPHDGASGNIAAVQVPRLIADENASAQLAMACYDYARWVTHAVGAGLDERAVGYSWNTREEKRFKKILAQGLPLDFVRRGKGKEMASVSGIDGGVGGIIFEQGGGVDPCALTSGLLAGAHVRYGVEVSEISPEASGWRIHFDDGGAMTARKVVLAGGAEMARLVEKWWRVPVQITAGRVSHLPPETVPITAAMSFGGYMARARDGMIALGASFDKNLDDILKIDNALHDENIDLIPPPIRAGLPSNFGMNKQEWGGRMSHRLAAADREPVAGRLDNGLFILTALGARGMVTGPLLGEYMASLILDLPSPISREMVAVVHPHRFRG